MKLQYSKMKLEYIPEKPKLSPRDVIGVSVLSMTGVALILIAIFLMSISLHAGPLMVALPGMLGLFCLISAIAGNFFRLKIPYDTPASGTMPQTYDDTLASSKMLKIPYAAIANGTMHQTSNNSEENCVYVYL